MFAFIVCVCGGGVRFVFGLCVLSNFSYLAEEARAGCNNFAFIVTLLKDDTHN